MRKDFLEHPRSAEELGISAAEMYSSTKAACYFLASEFAQRQPISGSVLHVAGNPGNYNTGLWVHVPSFLYFLARPILRDPFPHGADTWLWMGLSDAVTLEDATAGRYAMCDGRWHPGQRDDLLLALRRVDEGGSGQAGDVYDWCKKTVATYLN